VVVHKGRNGSLYPYRQTAGATKGFRPLDLLRIEVKGMPKPGEHNTGSSAHPAIRPGDRLAHVPRAEAEAAEASIPF
jgi:hypothetical protein